MGQGTLEQVVAGRVVVAIQAHEHVLVSPGQCDALRSELESVIAPTLSDWRDTLPPPPPDAVDPDSERPSSRPLADPSHSDPGPQVESIADQITEQLHSSDHIEDIYAADGAIRRDALVAVRETLLGFMRGDLPLVQTQPGMLVVQLDELGDMTRFITRALGQQELSQVLQEAAGRVGGVLQSLRAEDHNATFTFQDSSRDYAIALEEAIVACLLRVVEADQVELPAIEQMLQLSAGRLDTPSVRAALATACDRIRQHTGCVARCQVIDATTLRVRLIPLTEASAERLDEHYDELLSLLQEALSQAEDSEVSSPRPSAPASKRYPAGARDSQRYKRRRKSTSERARKSRPKPKRTRPQPRRNRRTGG